METHAINYSTSSTRIYSITSTRCKTGVQGELTFCIHQGTRNRRICSHSIWRRAMCKHSQALPQALTTPHDTTNYGREVRVYVHKNVVHSATCRSYVHVHVHAHHLLLTTITCNVVLYMVHVHPVIKRITWLHVKTAYMWKHDWLNAHRNMTGMMMSRHFLVWPNAAIRLELSWCAIGNMT